ncbi:MAG: PAS domain S-box protein, partial [Pseudomonadota bacterium]
TSYFSHFFMVTAQGLLEIRSAPIQPSWDYERTSQPRGFIFAGRLWSSNYIATLSQLTESTIQILPVTSDETFDTKYDQDRGIISFSRVLYGWDKKPLARIHIQSDSPVTREINIASKNQLILLVVFVSLIVFLLYVLLLAWVNIPLKKISLSLHTQDLSLIRDMTASKAEFGKLAQLILTFFHQRDELRLEVQERTKAEDALRVALQESKRSEAETASLLQVSRSVLEYHDFQQSSRSILTICCQLSHASAGFIAEIVERNSKKILAATSLSLPWPADSLPAMPLQGIYEDACCSGSPCYCNDFTQHISVDTLPAGHLSIRNMLCAPLQISNETVALLVLANKEEGFGENDIRMAAAFSELASVALFNSRTLESLEASEERFRSVVQTASDAVITVTDDERIIFWNRAAETVFGYASSEVENRDAAILVPERYRTALTRGAVQSLENETVFSDKKTVEMIGLRKDGSEFPMEISRSAWKTKEGGFFTAIARDITERKRSEENLRSSEKRLSAIVENSLTGILITQDTKVVFKNREIDRLLHTLPEKFSLYNAGHIYPDDREKVRAFYNELTAGDGPTRDAVFRLSPQGAMLSASEIRWVTCRGAAIEYQGKKALFINMMDITRIMELEQLIRIQEKMASLGRVAAGIAHEIRNPLTGINTYLYTLRDRAAGSSDQASEDKEEMLPIIEEIQAASNKIEAVIRRVMDFSKPNLPRLSRIDCNRVIEEALKLYAVTLRRSGIVVEKSLGSDLPLCAADFSMIEQVLLNLLTNASQAMGLWSGEKKIQVLSCRSGDTVAITVADSGPGIPLENRNKIFEPFYTTKADGSGIGLSLCQRIITDHRGTLSVGTSSLGGAEFKIEIPLKKGNADHY